MLSIITSMYNEEENAERVIKELADVSRKSKGSEVIIVDNGSKDKTGKICDSVGRRYKNVKIVHVRGPTQGKGSGIRAGFENARGDILAFIDGDLQQHPGDILKLMKAMEERNLDYIVGWRKDRKDSLSRLFMSRVYNVFIKILFNLPVRDTGGQPRLFRRKALEGLDIKAKRWLIEVELPYYAKRRGYRGGWAPVSHRGREEGESKINLKEAFRMFSDMIKMRMGSEDV